MGRKLSWMAVMLAGPLAFGAAGSVRAAADQQQIPASNASRMPPTPPYNGQPQSRGVAGHTFDDLAGSKGYITEEDAQRDPWLRSHFTECDTNRDGKISRREYNHCRKDQRTIGLQPQPETSTPRRGCGERRIPAALRPAAGMCGAGGECWNAARPDAGAQGRSRKCDDIA